MTDWIALWMVSGVQHITFRKYPGFFRELEMRLTFVGMQ